MGLVKSKICQSIEQFVFAIIKKCQLQLDELPYEIFCLNKDSDQKLSKIQFAVRPGLFLKNIQMAVYNSSINFNYTLNHYLVINEMVTNFKGHVLIRDTRMKKIKDHFDLTITSDLCT